MAPANSSASPPRMTNLEEPRLERPAVSAKGTVRPSLNPIMASRRRIGSRRVRPWPFVVGFVGTEDGIEEEGAGEADPAMLDRDESDEALSGEWVVCRGGGSFGVAIRWVDGN